MGEHRLAGVGLIVIGCPVGKQCWGLIAHWLGHCLRVFVWVLLLVGSALFLQNQLGASVPTACPSSPALQ